MLAKKIEYITKKLNYLHFCFCWYNFF